MRRSFFVLFAALFFSPLLGAQTPITIGDAVQRSLAQYPSVRSSSERARASSEGIGLARTSYLPRLDVGGQLTHATRNNVFGLFLPQPMVAPISGPVLGQRDSTAVWGSALGASLSWEAIDFGRRSAEVQVAQAGNRESEAALGVTRLQVATAAADRFLRVLAAERATIAAQAAVDRARAFLQVVEALVRSQLRPGVDAARAQAELALAETQLIQAQEATEEAKISLAQLLGVPASSLVVQEGPLLQNVPGEGPASDETSSHPLAREQTAAVEQARAREKVTHRSYFPSVQVHALGFARGSGAQVDGSVASGLAAPNVKNWAFASTVSFPLFELFSLRARARVEAHEREAESSRYEELLRGLNGEVEQSKARLNAARRIAEKTQARLDAAGSSEQQATARYRAGLATLIEVADAQRILTQAEIDDALGKLDVWRALLALAAANGSIEPFLSQAAQ